MQKHSWFWKTCCRGRRQMDNSIQDEVLRSFQSIAGQIGSTEAGAIDGLQAFNSAARDLPEAVGGLTQAVDELGLSAARQDSAAWIVSAAVSPATQSSNSGGGISAGDVASTILKSSFGVVPLVQGIISLFSGGGDSQPSPLVKYQAPDSVQVDAALWGGEAGPADYDQSGVLRRWTGSTEPASAGAVANLPATEPRAASAATGSQVVNVTVNAMDSRSFLDHSQEIALAVREAMLNMSPINDVVSEL
jgi:hypothetical protein